jgi:hypothetical protein
MVCTPGQVAQTYFIERKSALVGDQVSSFITVYSQFYEQNCLKATQKDEEVEAFCAFITTDQVIILGQYGAPENRGQLREHQHQINRASCPGQGD